MPYIETKYTSNDSVSLSDGMNSIENIYKTIFENLKSQTWN